MEMNRNDGLTSVKGKNKSLSTLYLLVGEKQQHNIPKRFRKKKHLSSDYAKLSPDKSITKTRHYHPQKTI